ncbi:hypothetical protein [Enterococcus faecium]|uniref:hypothetical protein n=1 Tax=Enterococcus faecium TaxID=1352 RepID=UPI001F50499D|nr:hypothetical protein [Enterococcus faecium]
MKEISANEAHIPQRIRLVYIRCFMVKEFINKLLTGYNNGANGKWLKATSIREL